LHPLAAGALLHPLEQAGAEQQLPHESQQVSQQLFLQPNNFASNPPPLVKQQPLSQQAGSQPQAGAQLLQQLDSQPQDASQQLLLQQLDSQPQDASQQLLPQQLDSQPQAGSQQLFPQQLDSQPQAGSQQLLQPVSQQVLSQPQPFRPSIRSSKSKAKVCEAKLVANTIAPTRILRFMESRLLRPNVLKVLSNHFYLAPGGI
jgi:hypothetical protein